MRVLTPSHLARVAVLALLGLLLAPRPSQAAEVPLNLQAALFTKIFKLNQKLASKGDDLELLIVHAPGQLSQAYQVTTAFSRAGVRAQAVSTTSLRSKVSGADVVYVMSGVDAAEVSGLVASNGVLSIAGSSDPVEGGQVAVGVELGHGGRPKIVLNLRRASNETHTFSSQLLRLARIVH
ncbi:MAG: YfiR/HmsC family protein [Deltaproteobacteria bacterium]|nr:YfiR/HmsC family protein [Deltaproteobacteria bacterium]